MTPSETPEDSPRNAVSVPFSEEPNMSKRALQQEAKAWREIAERIDPYHGDGFLCFQINEVGGEIEDSAMRRLRLYLGGAYVAYGDVHNTDLDMRADAPSDGADMDRPSRVLFCLLMALECDDEARSATPKKRSSEGTR